MKIYEIWIGNYYTGGEYFPPAEPERLHEGIAAIDFKTACMKYQLMATLAGIVKQEEEVGYVDNQSYQWFFDADNLLHGVMGRFYETREEALKSFTVHE